MGRMGSHHTSHLNVVTTSMQKRLHWLVALLILGALAVPNATNAQTSAGIRLISPQTDSFPHIQVYLDVHDAQGAFVHGLEAGDVRILENGQTLPIAELSAIQPGLQAVLVACIVLAFVVLIHIA